MREGRSVELRKKGGPEIFSCMSVAALFSSKNIIIASFSALTLVGTAALGYSSHRADDIAETKRYTDEQLMPLHQRLDRLEATDKEMLRLLYRIDGKTAGQGLVPPLDIQR